MAREHAAEPGRKTITQIDWARAGEITREMRIVAEKEGRDAESIRAAVAEGRIAIPANIHHASLDPEGVGDGLRTKVNVNLGISGDLADEAEEWRKVEVALELGAEGIMDLSNHGKTRPFRRALVKRSSAMIGTVPMYDAVGFLDKGLVSITADDFLDVVRAHAEDGVDFVTIHAGINRKTVESFLETGRLMNIVSRGGSLLFAWMHATGNENPFFERYDDLLDILHEHDVTISLGDAMRPGAIADSTDASQITELVEIGKLVTRAWDAGVQVMVEGPGHMALDEIAAASGADFLCYVTPAEHLRLPDADDVREGLIATKIAAHAADIAKGVPGARERDNAMSDARHRVDWETMFSLALDPARPREYFESAPPSNEGTCTMCGEQCAIRMCASAL